MATRESNIKNPFRPGAGHSPPYLAGRNSENEEFRKLLRQSTILENLVLTGLRGVGKTVLLDSFKQAAQGEKWPWVGTDLSESSSVSEESVAIRLLADLSVATSSMAIGAEQQAAIGFSRAVEKSEVFLSYETLLTEFGATPGLIEDKLKHVLELVWRAFEARNLRGLILAYDEAQNLSDHATKEEYPLSILLSVFQSIQRKNIPFMLVLTGLPTLFPKLVEARAFAERMFRVMFLDKLPKDDTSDAILRPLEVRGCPITFDEKTVSSITDLSGGYPYFIQFICRETYDVFVQQKTTGEEQKIPKSEILNKLDSDFFAGRWAKVSDRQRVLLGIIANLESCEAEFTILEIVERANKDLDKPFSSSQVNQMLARLGDDGLIYKNRHGRYSFAVPLLNRFIRRQGGSARSRWCA